jgi:hypothetical protein
MIAPLDDLRTRITEIEADCEFVALAAKLRPRIGEAIKWDASTDVVSLVRQFMDVKSSRTEGIYGPLLVRLLAAFERFLRRLVAQSVEKRASAVTIFDLLPEHLRKRNLVLTGRVLASVESPRDYLALDSEFLIDNLASCKHGSGTFRLNSQAFSATVTGANPAVIEYALGTIEVKNWWDGVGANTDLQGLLGTKKSRETGVRAREKLDELCKWRNHWAHGGDKEISLTESELRDAISFIARFSAALDGAVKKQLR